MIPLALVDTHQHAWELRRFPYTWCASIAALNRSFSFGDYAAAAAGTGIARTVFMECDVDEPHGLAEARHVESLAGRPIAPGGPALSGIVAAARPEQEGFRAHLDALALLPHVRGVRRILHTQPDELSQAPLFAEHLRLLPEREFTFDLCVLARQLPLAIRLARQCPEVTFILDHCGVPDVKARAFDPWRDHIRALSDCPNVAAKISGIAAYADSGWTVETLRPWVQHVIDCFGWDRVVWGGDWPVCTLGTSLARWVEAARELTASAEPIQQEKLFFRNAERIYRL